MSNGPIRLGITIHADGSAQVNGELDRVRNGLGGASNAAQNANRSFAAMARETLGLGSALKGLAAGLSVVALYQSTKDIVMLADKMTLLDSRIKIATSNQKDYLASSKELVAISLRTGTSFEANATIFSRINKAMEDMGGSIRNTTALTETLAQTMRISGTAGGEAAATIRQLSQALSSGVLRGDEFNSIMENAPRLAQALADGMHVSIGTLRAMAEAGELTSKRVIEAIQSQGKVIDDEFKRIPLTVGTAMENVATAFGQYVLEANKGAGATAGLAQQINILANNLTPIVDGLVTLGKVAVTVFASQMLVSIGKYIAAKYQAITVEAAHAAAITMDLERTVALTAAQLAVTEATIAATQATLAGNLSMGARMAITNQLNLLLVEQVAAQNAVNLALAAGRPAITAAAIAMGALNAAMGVFIAFQVKQYLEDLFTGSDFAAKSMGALATWIEEVSRRFLLLKAVFTSDTWDEVNAASAKTKQSYIDLTNELLKNNEEARNHAKLSGEMQADIDALKSPLEVYTQKVKDAQEALAAHAITQATANALLAKYKETLDQANEAAANAKLSDAGKELVKLRDKYAQLTLSVEDYNKKHAEGFKGTAAEIAEVARLSNAIDALEEGKKALTKTTQEFTSAEKALQSAYDSGITSMEKEIALRGNSTKAAAMEYEVTVGALSKLSEAKKLKLLQDAAELDNQALLKKAADTQKTTMDELDDKYRQLTLSARDYFIAKTKIDNPGITPEQLGVDTVKFDRNAGVEAQQKSIESARSALEAYNSTLDSTHDKMASLTDVSSAVFDSTLGGLDKVTGGFTNMLKALNDDAAALKNLYDMKIVNDRLDRDVSNRTAEQIKKNNGQYLIDLNTIAKFKNTFALKEQSLNTEVLKDSLSGIRQTSSALGQMFAENTTARKVFNIVSLAASVSERLADIAQLQVKASIAVLEQGKSDPYTAFARMAAMASIVASIIAAAGAGTFNFSGGSGKSPGLQGMSPDTGTVLGDPSAKSQSIDKTYQLLKDIHAEEYAELKAINQGIASLHDGITNVITRLFQAGGLTAVTAPASAYKPGGGIIGSSTQAALQFANFPTAALGMKIDPISNFLLNGIFGGKQESAVIGQGISTNPTSIANIIAGGNLAAQQFAQIETKTSGGWFGKDKFSFTNQYAPLDAATQKALDSVFRSMGGTMLSLADTLGLGLSDRVKNYIIPALTVDLKGLNGEDAAKKLNGVISTALDTMSTAVFGDILGQYQQLGEGMLETAVRIVTQIAVVKDAFSTTSAKFSGDIIAISDALIRAAGGIQEFQKQIGAYYDKFYSDSEKQDKLKKQLSTALKEVFIFDLPDTREGYRHRLELLKALEYEFEQNQYSTLLKLSGQADKYYAYLEQKAADALAAAKQLADQKHALDIQLMEAQGNAVGALAAKRKDELAALDSSLRATQLAVWAAQDLAKSLADSNAALDTALDTAMGRLSKSVAAQKTINNDAHQAQLKDLKDRLDATLETNKLQKQAASDLLSTLTTVAGNIKNAIQSTVVETDALTRQRRLSAQSVLLAALDTAKTGGSLANFAGLDQALTDIAKPSEQLFATFVDYARDQGRTGNVIRSLADHAEIQVSVAQQTVNAIDAAAVAAQAQYDSQNKLLTDAFNAETSRLDGLLTTAQTQIDVLRGIDNSVLSVADALAGIARASSASVAAKAATPASTPAVLTAKAMALAELNNAMAAADAANKAPSGKTQAEYKKFMQGVVDARNKVSIAQAAYDALPKFAEGGRHSGGWALVGERGPELVNMPPSRVFNHQESKTLVDNSVLVEEIKKLREDNKAQARAIVDVQLKTMRLMQRWDGDGLPQTRVVTA